MIRRPPRSTLSSSSAASDVYKRQVQRGQGLVKIFQPVAGKNVFRRDVSKPSPQIGDDGVLRDELPAIVEWPPSLESTSWPVACGMLTAMPRTVPGPRAARG